MNEFFVLKRKLSHETIRLKGKKDQVRLMIQDIKDTGYVTILNIGQLEKVKGYTDLYSCILNVVVPSIAE